MGADFGEIVEDGFPICVTQFGEFQNGCKFLIDFQEGNILEGQAAVGDDALELVAQTLGFFTHLVQIRTPVECILRFLYHHTCYRPYLRHDFGGNHAVDTAVVVVFGAARPQTQIRQSFTVKILTGKDSGSSDFCSLITFADFR